MSTNWRYTHVHFVTAWRQQAKQNIVWQPTRPKTRQDYWLVDFVAKKEDFWTPVIVFQIVKKEETKPTNQRTGGNATNDTDGTRHESTNQMLFPEKNSSWTSSCWDIPSISHLFGWLIVLVEGPSQICTSQNNCSSCKLFQWSSPLLSLLCYWSRRRDNQEEYGTRTETRLRPVTITVSISFHFILHCLCIFTNDTT